MMFSKAQQFRSSLKDTTAPEKAARQFKEKLFYPGCFCFLFSFREQFKDFGDLFIYIHSVKGDIQPFVF